MRTMGYRTPHIVLRLEPAVVRSIVESSGMDHAAIAQRLRVDKPRVDGWVRTGVIEYAKVRALARCVRRSETLFLRTVPLEREHLPDYRMMRGAPEVLDPRDLPAVRRVRYMLSAAKEMMDVCGIARGPDIPAGVAVATPADGAARAERARLGAAGHPDGPVAGSPSGIYRALRGAIEERNIFVFQLPLRTDGVRGLSMAGPGPCAILVNSRENSTARASTLLHEYGHIMLGRGGVCDEHGTVRADSDKGRVEAWCDRFAASFLMPEAAFAAERGRLEGLLGDPSEVVGGLAKRFKAGRYAAASRAADLVGGRYGAAYGGVLDGVAGRCSLGRAAAVERGGPRHLDALVSRLGRKFVGLAVSSHEKKAITTRDLLDYLGIKIGHLDELCKRMGMAA